MPFCTQCGNQVGPADQFCGSCGTRQGNPGAPKASFAAAGAGSHSSSASTSDALNNLTPRNASILCYIPIVGWIAAIVVLAVERFRDDKDVRFHAFQGLYLFVIWLFVDWVFSPITANLQSLHFIGKLMKAAVLCAWIFMLVKTSQGILFRLPFIGELAERSVSEQK